jgi:hypothetical protein
MFKAERFDPQAWARLFMTQARNMWCLFSNTMTDSQCMTADFLIDSSQDTASRLGRGSRKRFATKGYIWERHLIVSSTTFSWGRPGISDINDPVRGALWTGAHLATQQGPYPSLDNDFTYVSPNGLATGWPARPKSFRNIIRRRFL